MGAPGSCGQITLVLKNAALAETAISGSREAAPTHACDDGVCTMIFECGWMRTWRAARAAGDPAIPAEPLLSPSPPAKKRSRR